MGFQPGSARNSESFASGEGIHRRKAGILHCIAALEKGGAERQLRLLLDHHDRQRFRVAVLCLSDSVSTPLPPEVQVLKVDRGERWNLLGLWSTIIRVAWRYNPDLFHLWLPEIVTIPAALAGVARKRPIISAQRSAPDRRISARRWPVLDRATYVAHLLSTRLIPNFDPEDVNAPLFKWLFARKKGRVIPNGVPAEFLSVRPVDDGVHANGSLNIVYAGRLVKSKNVASLLHAVSDLAVEGVPLKVHLFGDGPEEGSLRSLVREIRLDDQVVFHGHRADWPQLACGADMFVFPSISEGMSNVLLEACAIGLPVVAVDMPSVRALLRHEVSAYLVPANSHVALREAIACLLRNEPLRTSIGSSARSVAERFSAIRMTRAYETLYLELLRERTPHSG